jgi:SAM-dependent methyltransferase
MNRLARSWSSFTPGAAAAYMRGFGHPAESSKELLADVMRTHVGTDASILELGCGNGQLYEYLRTQGFRGRYLGLDFSTVLLGVATEQYGADPGAEFLERDVCTLEDVPGGWDVALYSHVFEALASPEQSLIRARELAKTTVIRFFEAPEHEIDWVELREMEIGDDQTVPYIRRSMSRDYYRLLLTKAGASRVDIYRDDRSTDQVHVLSYQQ